MSDKNLSQQIAAASFVEGTRVTIIKDVTLCLADIPAGESGEVIDVDPENGDLVILLDNPFPDLLHTGNTIWLPAQQYDVLHLRES